MKRDILALNAGLFLLLCPAFLGAQSGAPDVRSKDSVTVAAGAHYKAAGLHRWLFGGAYRDLWTMPVRAPVLELRTFGGGLTPMKTGGGKQTKSLRFTTPDGAEYIFRSVDKDGVALPVQLRAVGLAEDVARDQTSSSHPAANLVAAPILAAVGVLHEDPVLVVLPDDTILGKYRKEFAHRLGIFTRYPQKTSKTTTGIGGAVDVIDSDSLLRLLDRDPSEQVEPHVFLAARLIDMLLNNYDRHPGNWKWARLDARGPWLPISRDQDKVLLSASGVLPNLLKGASATMIRLDSTYPGMKSLTFNSLELDRRLLGGLEKPAFDSVARWVSHQVTNDVIDAGIHGMPPEYLPGTASIVAKLRVRRDSIPVVADRFYRLLAGVIDLHATNAAERLTITRVDNRFTDIAMVSPSGVRFFDRRFDALETRAIRIYLHDGDDVAVIRGTVQSAIPLWIVGGRGDNQLVDSSVVGGARHTVHLYNVGPTTKVKYGKDTLFNRRPLVHSLEAGRDHGTSGSPIVGLSLNRDMGVMPRFGLMRRHYAFGKVPYATMFAAEARYSFKNSGLLVAATADMRRENSLVHYTAFARMSQLEMLNFHGLGNSSPATAGLLANVSAPRTDYYALRQRQWLFQPSVGMALGPRADLSVGPMFQYSVTDNTPDRFVSVTAPYGSGSFSEAGLRLTLTRDSRVPTRHAHRGTILDVSATWFPAMLDVRSAFETVSASGAVYFTLPVPTHPYLALRGGGKKVFGDAPFQELAFIGGRNDVRTLDLQRYAGDASLYGTAELRIPVAEFNLLLPLNVGLLATGDIGRVFVKGDSPGGWHNAVGAGFWVGFHELTADIRFLRANEIGRTSVIALRFVAPVLP